MRIKLSVLALFVFLLTAVLTSAQAQTAPAMSSGQIPVGQIGGTVSAVAFNSGNLYFNVGPRIARLAVLNTAPLTPTLPAAYGDVLPGVPMDIKTANGYLYVALGKGGVAVIDPATLQTLSVQSLPITGTAEAVAVGSQQVYVAVGNDGIIGYDLGADKKTLTYAQTKSFSSPVRNIMDVEVRTIGGGQYLFVAGNNFTTTLANRGGVMKFDITGSATLGSAVKTIQLDANAMAVTDSFVFAAGDTDLYALDTAELGATGGVSSTVPLSFRGLEIALRPGDQTAYVADLIGAVDVVSIGTPSPAPAMAIVGTLFSNDYIGDVVAAEFTGDLNTYLYLADSGSGLSIASAPQADPGNVNLDRPSYVQPMPGISAVVAGAYPQAFVYSFPSMLWTVNTSNLNALSNVGSGLVATSTINAITPYTNSILVSADADGLLRYLINPAGDPILTDTVSTAGVAFDAAVAWPNAIVANGTNGLAVVDISDPVTMTLIGSVPSPNNGPFTHVAVQGNYAYVADNGNIFDKNGAFRVYDLSNPAAPAATGSVTQTGILDLKVSGNLAFLAVGSQGVRVVDITNPAAPAIINTDDYTGTTVAQGLAIYSHYLFVTSGDAGVQMLSFDPTGQLSLVATIPTAGSASRLAWVPGQLYIADDVGGLTVFQIGNDVAITKTAPATVYAGQNFTYTLSVGNIGQTPATGVIITDALPANVSLVSAQNCTADSGIITCTVGSLAMGGSASYNIVVSAATADTYTNTASVYSTELDVDTTNNSSSAMTTVLPAVDLVLTQADTPDPVYVGGTLTYTLHLSNNGPSDATGTVVTDTLPAGVTPIQAGPNCSLATPIVCNVGALDSGATETMTIVVNVTPAAGALITNTAVATADQMNLTPASATATTTVAPVADLSITKVGAPNPVYINQPLTYTLVIANLGPSTATNVLMTDTLPVSVTFKSVSGASCSGTHVVVCNLGNMAATNATTVTLVVVPTSATPSENSATVTSSVFDPVMQNNTVGPVITTVIKYKVMLPLVRR